MFILDKISNFENNISNPQLCSIFDVCNEFYQRVMGFNKTFNRSDFVHSLQKSGFEINLRSD